jgi:hypothetical protein
MTTPDPVPVSSPGAASRPALLAALAFPLAATAALIGIGTAIGTFAELGDRSHFIVRGTKLLALSSLMGHNHRVRFPTAQAAPHAVTTAPIDWIVLDSPPPQERMEHVAQLLPLLAPPGAWRLYARFEGSGGAVLLYRRPAPQIPPQDRAAFIARLGPAKLVR